MTKYSLSFVIFALYCIQNSRCIDFTNSAFGLNIHNILPAAFGDFNSDELTDLFVINNNASGGSVQILLGSLKEPHFIQDSNLQCFLPNKTITSVVPGDYDGDGLMDVLITTAMNSTDNFVFDMVFN